MNETATIVGGIIFAIVFFGTIIYLYYQRKTRPVPTKSLSTVSIQSVQLQDSSRSSKSSVGEPIPMKPRRMVTKPKKIITDAGMTVPRHIMGDSSSSSSDDSPAKPVWTAADVGIMEDPTHVQFQDAQKRNYADLTMVNAGFDVAGWDM